MKFTSQIVRLKYEPLRSVTFFLLSFFFFFFFNDTATTEIYTLSLHDALPISPRPSRAPQGLFSSMPMIRPWPRTSTTPDRKSTRLNSSHGYISYAVFCLKKKKQHCNMKRVYVRNSYSDMAWSTYIRVTTVGDI